MVGKLPQSATYAKNTASPDILRAIIISLEAVEVYLFLDLDTTTKSTNTVIYFLRRRTTDISTGWLNAITSSRSNHWQGSVSMMQPLCVGCLRSGGMVDEEENCVGALHLGSWKGAQRVQEDIVRGQVQYIPG